MTILNALITPIIVILIGLLLIAIVVVIYAIFKTKRASVLIIDDEPEIIDHLREFLIEKNFDVRAVSTVEEAKILIYKENFDYVTVDLGMKTENSEYGKWGGIEIFNLLRERLQQIQESESYLRTKVLVLSGHSLEEIADAGFKGEARLMRQDFISKSDPNHNYILELLEKLGV